MNQNKKMIINYKLMNICIATWLLISFMIGITCSDFIRINSLNELLFVHPEMVNNQNYYSSVMACLVFLSPFAFIYLYKYCILSIGIDNKYLWTILLAITLGLAWNSGYITIDNRPDNHYKYDLLFIYLIQKLDWIGAIFISFIGIYMTIFFSVMLCVFFMKKNQGSKS